MLSGTMLFMLATVAFAYFTLAASWVTSRVEGEGEATTPFTVFVTFAVTIVIGVTYMVWHRGWGWLGTFWRFRPSDIVFGPTALRVDGGPHHGFSIDYADIDPEKCVIEPRRAVLFRDPRTGKKTLSSKTVDARVLRLEGESLAEADETEPDELASLEEVHQAILARVVAEPQVERPRAEARVLACPSCGAPVAPSDRPEGPCAHCGAAVAMPEELRVRVEAARKLPAAEARAARFVEMLLEQPGARSMTAFLMASIAIMVLPCPLVAALAARLSHRHALTPLFVAGLALLPLLFVIDGFFLSRYRFVDRRAIRTVVTSFAALRPERADGPPRCHSCLAPLHDSDSVVVTCVYCAAPNVTGVDLRGSVRKAKASTKALVEALAGRDFERRAWMRATLWSLPFAIATIALLAVAMVR